MSMSCSDVFVDQIVLYVRVRKVNLNKWIFNDSNIDFFFCFCLCFCFKRNQTIGVCVCVYYAQWQETICNRNINKYTNINAQYF